jgi:RNA polymerase sigma-70 factor (ECF subfamily)
MNKETTSSMDRKEEKFKQIVADNKARITRIARYYAPSAEDQHDIFQEILINIWKSLETFRGESSIETWIYRIAVNTSLGYAGKHYRLMKLNVDINAPDIIGRLVDDNDDGNAREKLSQDLQIHLNQLGVIDKAIMGLVLDDLPTKEISEIIGITEPNVRVKVHRIKETLRERMKGGQDE